MPGDKQIQVDLAVAKDIIRVLEKFEVEICFDCPGQYHEDDCPAKKAYQLRNYLLRKVNNPNRKYGK